MKENEVMRAMRVALESANPPPIASLFVRDSASPNGKTASASGYAVTNHVVCFDSHRPQVYVELTALDKDASMPVHYASLRELRLYYVPLPPHRHPQKSEDETPCIEEMRLDAASPNKTQREPVALAGLVAGATYRQRDLGDGDSDARTWKLGAYVTPGQSGGKPVWHVELLNEDTKHIVVTIHVTLSNFVKYYERVGAPANGPAKWLPEVGAAYRKQCEFTIWRVDFLDTAREKAVLLTRPARPSTGQLNHDRWVPLDDLHKNYVRMESCERRSAKFKGKEQAVMTDELNNYVVKYAELTDNFTGDVGQSVVLRLEGKTLKDVLVEKEFSVRLTDVATEILNEWGGKDLRLTLIFATDIASGITPAPKVLCVRITAYQDGQTVESPIKPAGKKSKAAKGERTVTYIAWDEVAESAKAATTAMVAFDGDRCTFNVALDTILDIVLSKGRRAAIRRTNWPENHYVFVQKGSAAPVYLSENVTHFNYANVKHFLVDARGTTPQMPVLALWQDDSRVLGWAPTQEDIFAENWLVSTI